MGKKNKTPEKWLVVWQKSTVFVIIFSFVFSPLFPTQTKKSEAFTAAAALMVPTNDVIGNVKDSFLDGIAYAAAKLVVQEIVRSTVNWINNGFEGNPGFLENPGEFFKDLADQELGRFLEGSEFGFLCSPFQIQIKLALITKHYGSRISNCSLSDILNNVQNFEDFVSISDTSSTRNVGGWSDWYDLTQPAGNPYGAYAAAEAEATLRINTSRGSIQKELDLGRGLLSFRDCSGVVNRGPGKVNCPIKTPGSVIETQLNKVLGSSLEGLIAADEINEIIGALLGQLLQQVLGGSGLSGAGQSNSNYGGRSYLNELERESNSTLNTNVGTLNEQISESLDTLGEYSQTKNQSLLRVKTSIGLQNQVIYRCEGNLGYVGYNLPPNYRGLSNITSSQATAASSTINTVLNPIKTRLESEIETANDKREELDNIRKDVNALDRADTNGFLLLFNQYTELVRPTDTENIFSTATSERDFTLPQQLNPIDASAQTTINYCNSIYNFNFGF